MYEKEASLSGAGEYLEVASLTGRTPGPKPKQPDTPPSEEYKTPERSQEREEERAEEKHIDHTGFLSDLHHKLDEVKKRTEETVVEVKKRTEETVKVRGARVRTWDAAGMSTTSALLLLACLNRTFGTPHHLGRVLAPRCRARTLLLAAAVQNAMSWRWQPAEFYTAPNLLLLLGATAAAPFRTRPACISLPARVTVQFSVRPQSLRERA